MSRKGSGQLWKSQLLCWSWTNKKNKFPTTAAIYLEDKLTNKACRYIAVWLGFSSELKGNQNSLDGKNVCAKCRYLNQQLEHCWELWRLSTAVQRRPMLILIRILRKLKEFIKEAQSWSGFSVSTKLTTFPRVPPSKGLVQSSYCNMVKTGDQLQGECQPNWMAKCSAMKIL